jgi:hypothetical protein
MDFDAHLLRMTSALIGILDRSQRLHDEAKGGACLLLVDSERAMLPLCKDI